MTEGLHKLSELHKPHHFIGASSALVMGILLYSSMMGEFARAATTQPTATNTPIAPTSYTLSVLKSGTGSGTVTSASTGINCGVVCSATFTTGIEVTLTATPAVGSTFSGFTGCTPIVNAAIATGTTLVVDTTCSVNMTAVKSVMVTFSAVAPPVQIPTVTTQPASTIGSADATLNGLANPNSYVATADNGVSSGVVEESNENNNTLVKTIIVDGVVVQPGSKPFSLSDITTDAQAVVNGSGTYTRSTTDTNTTQQLFSRAEVITKKIQALQDELATITPQLKDFITLGTSTTQKLGLGERAGVVSSFASAFGKAPSTEGDWQDVIKIANGRWPTQRSGVKEIQATETFKQIYQRYPNRANKHDDAAMTVMAYGLRPVNRNLQSEAAAIEIFGSIIGHEPTSSPDWDAVRAIAYSGATQ